jgi:hypothetical protein
LQGAPARTSCTYCTGRNRLASTRNTKRKPPNLLRLGGSVEYSQGRGRGFVDRRTIYRILIFLGAIVLIWLTIWAVKLAQRVPAVSTY